MNRRNVRRKRERRGVGLLLVLLALAGCEWYSPTGSGGEGSSIPLLDLDRAAGQPGQTFELGGTFVTRLVSRGVDLAGERITLQVGGIEASLKLFDDGRLVGSVPVFAAGEDGQSPPAGPQDVVLLQRGDPIAARAMALTIEALPAAPGETSDFIDALAALQSELRGVSDLLGEPGTLEYGYATSVLGALEQLLVGTDEESLASALAATSPATRDFIDRFVASTQIVPRTRALADLYASAASDASEAMALMAPVETVVAIQPIEMAYEAPDGVITVTDRTLARKMQYQVILELFSQTVINETASEWGEASVGIGAISLVLDNIPEVLADGVPLAGLVSSVLGIADFVANKILVGLQPSEVTNLVVDPVEPRLDYNSSTVARVWVEAQNTPPGVGVQDVVGLTLSVLGLIPGGGSAASRFEDVLLQTANYFIGTIQAGLAAYSGANPDLNMDVSFSVIPVSTWNALVSDRRFLDLVTFTPEIVTPLADEVNWTSGDVPGEGRIAARIATGPDARIISPPPGFSYNGGAFGESVLQSETESVFVEGPLGLAIVSAPSTLEPGEIGTLIVEAGIASGDAVAPQPGIDIEITIDGGTVETSTGPTDADGLFTTTIQLGAGSESLIVSITARNAFNEFLTESLTIGVPATSSVVWEENLSYFEARASAFVSFPGAQDFGFGVDSASTTDFTSGLLQAEASAQTANERNSVATESSGTLDWVFEDLGEVQVFRGSGVSTATGSQSDFGEDATRGQTAGVLAAIFNVSEPTSYRITAETNGTYQGPGLPDIPIVLVELSEIGEAQLLRRSLQSESSLVPESLDETGVLPPGRYLVRMIGIVDLDKESVRGAYRADHIFTARLQLGGS